MKPWIALSLGSFLLAVPSSVPALEVHRTDILAPLPNSWDTFDRIQEMLANAYYAGLGPYQQHVWPIGGTASPDFPLSDTYGPRLKTSEGGRYDWHRGIDIPAAENTPVLAIADGTVRIAGAYSSYSDSLVQLRHAKPDGSGDYYSNYMHLNSWCVTTNDAVTQGQVIGYSGSSTSDFEHLHFEIRDNGLYQRNCVHPLTAMPYADLTAPAVAIDDVDWTDPSNPVVQVTVDVSVDELDLGAVEVCTYRRTLLANHLYSYQEVDAQRFDIMYRNYSCTPTNDPDAYLDAADYGSVLVEPAEYSSTAGAWQITLTFTGLRGAGAASEQGVRVYAEDVNGNTDTDSENMLIYGVLTNRVATGISTGALLRE